MEVPLERFKLDNRHKWLYSVVPEFPHPEYPTGGIYLAGFCPACRNSFTVRLETSWTNGRIIMNKLDVPTTGCEPVE